MTNLRTRLEHGARVLAVIDARRHQTGDPSVGEALERHVVDRELRELEVEAFSTQDRPSQGF